MNKKLTEIFQKASQTLVNYPMVLLTSFIMSLTVIYAIETNSSTDENFFHIKIIFCTSFGISLFFALKILSQRISKQLLLTVIGLLFLVGYYFILPQNKDDFNEVYVFIIIPTYVLLHLLVAFIPYITTGNPEKKFWEYNKNLFVNFALTMIFTGVLTAGVELAVVSVDQLFSFHFDDKVYPEIFFLMSIFGSTFIFLLFNENGLEYLEKESTYPVVLKFFTQFILIPLLFIYAVILYFYSGKILLAWELPRGWVSYLILAYSVVGILALLLVHPLKEATTRSWVKMFSKIFYFSLIPLMVLLFTAIFTRLLQYGFTEPRYFVLLLALWLSAVILYFVFKKESSIKFIPVSLFLFGLFALIFPYFNTFSVAKRSQKKELEKILIANNLLDNGKINFNKKITDSIAKQVTDKFAFLNERFEKEYLEKFLTDSIKTKEEYKNGNFWNYSAFFSNVVTTSKEESTTYLNLNSKKTYYDVENYQYIITIPEYGTTEIKIKNDTFKVERISNEDVFLKISLNSKETVDLTPLIKAMFKKYHRASGDIDVDDLFIKSSLGNYEFRMSFNSLNKSNYSNKDEYNFNEGLLLIKEK